MGKAWLPVNMATPDPRANLASGEASGASSHADNHPEEQAVHVDLTSDLTEADQLLLSRMPGLQGFINTVQNHDWRHDVH